MLIFVHSTSWSGPFTMCCRAAFLRWQSGSPPTRCCTYPIGCWSRPGRGCSPWSATPWYPTGSGPPATGLGLELGTRYHPEPTWTPGAMVVGSSLGLNSHCLRNAFIFYRWGLTHCPGWPWITGSNWSSCLNLPKKLILPEHASVHGSNMSC